MQVRARIFFIVVIVFMVVPVISVLGYNLFIDPFQIFHKDFTKPTVILGGRGTDRYQQAGIINQYDIDSAIIGNSHSANYLPSQLKKDLGWNNVYTLTMDGAPLYEQGIVVKRLFSEHNVENVLWGVAAPALIRPWAAKNKKLPLREYLYDGNRVNDLRFFLTFDLQKYHEKKQRRRNKIIAAENSLQLAEEEFDKATSWYDRGKCSFNRPVFVAGKILHGKTLQYDEKTRKKIAILSSRELMKTLVESPRRYQNYQDNLQKNLLPVIRENPSTNFHFIVTAYPALRMQWMKITSPKMYVVYLQAVRQFVLDMRNYDNVQVFGFDEERFTGDLRLYKDQGHSHLAVNDYIIKQVARRNNLLTPSNIDGYITAFDERVSRYRLKEGWNPQRVNKYPKSGYLSMEAARMLIKDEHPYSDAEITEISLQDRSLPKCAKSIKKNLNN